MKRAIPLLLLAAATAAPVQAAPQTLGFDDLWGGPAIDQYFGSYVASFSSYGGLTWGPRFVVVNGYGECGAADCGFKNAQTSASYIATNGFDGTGTVTSPTPFRLLSIQLGSAWYDPLTISFVGKLGGSTVWNTSLDASPYAATQFSFPTGLIDTLEVSAVIAGPQVYPLGSGPRMVWDDFTFDAAPSIGGVPEPASWAMLLAGFGLTGLMARRRQREVAA